ncbi:DUF1642 domain-containing protein [uncultured Streptococcus sp.]|uniref:DUF1642 domain-containing protein n=1 Tax=uncultured Streptococcus sp. TaxID=83427 RepID=UPI00288A35EB|nr:DUF1642 domain-containing protein [uncultured Streptococcus sp.]
MNVHRLIEKFEERKTIIGNFQGYAVWWEDVKEIFEQLDEPQPVKVPQFVADWIEVCKEHLTTSLYTAMNPDFMKENNQSFDFILWIKKTSNQETFARAWLDGYEVEKEKRYTVVMKETKQPLYYNAGEKKLFFSLGGLATIFTQKQLEKAGLGWVFDCPGIEIEEVE